MSGDVVIVSAPPPPVNEYKAWYVFKLPGRQERGRHERVLSVLTCLMSHDLVPRSSWE